MKLKIKTWEKMEEEFGLDGADINCRYIYTTAMEDAIPADRVIPVYKDSDDAYVWDLDKSNNINYTRTRYFINDDMIEEYL